MQQRIDLRDGHAGTVGDTGATRTVDNRRIASLRRSHRTDDGFGTVDLPLVELFKFLTVRGHARNHAEQILHRAELAHLLQLVEEIVKTEGAVGNLHGGLTGLLFIELLLRLLDQGEDIAHVEDAGSHAIRVEDFEILQSFARRSEQDRLAGNGCDGKRGTATSIAIKLGKHHAGEVHAFVERLRRLHGILTDHRVDDEQDLIRLHGIADIAGLPHQFLINTETACGIDDDRVIQLLPGERHGIAGHLHRVSGGQARRGNGLTAGGLHALFRRIHRYAGTLADHLQLRHRVRTLQIGRDKQRGMAGILQPIAQLAGERRLTGALKACEHDDRRRILREVQRTIHAGAEHVSELFVDDLHDLLRRIQRLRNLSAERTLADTAGKGTHHVERHIGVEQRAANLTDRTVDIGLGKLAFALQMLEGIREPVCQRTKCCHNVPQSSRLLG